MKNLTVIPALIIAICTFAQPVCAKIDKPKPAPKVEFSLDTTTLDRNDKTRIVSYADVLAKVTPAVVSIKTSQTVAVMPNRGNADINSFLRRFWGLPDDDSESQNNVPAEATPQEKKVPVGLGSGTIIHPEGYVLTNRHVISLQNGKPADEIIVQLPDKREFSARVIGADPQSDVAIIKIDNAGDLPVAALANSDELRVGDVVFAIGNPLGVGQTVTSGIVSATGRSDLNIFRAQGINNAYESFIQTDAAINRGNSGGALVDALGRVVGVNTAIVSNSGGNIGIGFAIPASLAHNIITGLANGGQIHRGYLGFSGQDISREAAEALGLKNQQGVLVNEVVEKSPASTAGVRDGDVILSLDNEKVLSWNALRFKIAQFAPGTKILIGIFRDGKTQEIDATVGDAEKDAPAREGVSSLVPGVSFREIDAKARSEYGIPAEISGIVISKIERTSPLAGQLPPGTVIVSVNRVLTPTLKDFSKQLKKNKMNILRIWHNGRYYHIAFKL